MDGLNTPRELVKAASEAGQSAIALTDHGTMAGHREFQEAAEEFDVKPILGLEAYISATDRFDRRSTSKRSDGTQAYNHIILLAKNQQGLRNLNKLSELAWTEGFHSKPRIDRELLHKHGDELIVLSGCLNGLISKAIEKDDPYEAKRWLEFFGERFGKDFYIEIQAHNPSYINDQLLDYSQHYGFKHVVTSDVHYAYSADAEVEEALLVLSTNPKAEPGVTYEDIKGKSVIEQLDTLYPDRTMTFKNYNLYLQTEEELLADFGNMRIVQEGFAATQEIADKVEPYAYYKNLDLLPVPAIGKNDPYGTLQRLVREGLKERGVYDNKSYRDRAKEELNVIKDKDFTAYFLIIGDVVRYAKRRGILVGPGRGSAAGSLVCYALGITEVDPIEFDLLFFRFINPERNDFPDIDLDFQKSRRWEIKQYMRNKYGYVANIATWGFFKDKNVVKDAARVFKVPLKEVEALLNKLDRFEEFETGAAAAEFREKYPEVLWLAKKLHGRIRQGGIHAAGMVVANEPIENYVPIETRKDPDNAVSGRVPVVASDMNQVADVGLIKADFLGLITLDVIGDALHAIKERHGIDLKLPSKRSEFNDQKVFSMLQQGHTVGVFQADAAPYTALLREMRITSFDDLVASTALVRPGAKNTVGKPFLDRQHKREPVAYVHDSLKPFLEETYGVVVYQEQVMQTLVTLGGLSMSDADKVRKIIGKKRDVKEFEAFKDAFVNGASNKVSSKVAEALFHDFEAHAGYSFNKSHAVAYSMLTYWTAMLKLYYPLEFMWALLKNEAQQERRTVLLTEAKRLGAKVLLPHINKSDLDFTLEGDAIRFGLGSVKYISDKVAAPIIDNRPFTSFQQFSDFAAQKGSGVNSRAVQALNAIGAAAFKDSPKRGDEDEFLYEYLGIPKFNSSTLGAAENKINAVSDFNEEGIFVFRGVVKNIKRGKGWSRVEILDESASVGVFDVEQTTLEKNKFYVFLVGDNRIVYAVPPNEVEAAIGKSQWEIEDSFVRWLLTEDLGLHAGGPKYVVKFSKRKTKAGKLMGDLIVCNHAGELRKVLVFPKEFRRYYSLIVEGELLDLGTRKLDGGGYCLTQIM